MKIADVMRLTGASYPTIYVWVRKRGFPQPNNGEWDDEAVHAWWDRNKKEAGRRWRSDRSY